MGRQPTRTVGRRHSQIARYRGHRAARATGVSSRPRSRRRGDREGRAALTCFCMMASRSPPPDPRPCRSTPRSSGLTSAAFVCPCQHSLPSMAVRSTASQATAQATRRRSVPVELGNAPRAEVSSRNLRAAGSGQAAGLVSMTQTYGTDHFRVKRDANWVDPVKELGTKFFHSQVGLSTVGVNLEKQLSSGDVLLVGAGGGEREGDEERDELEQAAPLEEEEEEEEDDGTEIKGGVIGEWERMCVWAGGSHSVVGLRRKLRCELDPGVSGGGPQ
eukprot:989025-Rhodomonas_salina.2